VLTVHKDFCVFSTVCRRHVRQMTIKKEDGRCRKKLHGRAPVRRDPRAEQLPYPTDCSVYNNCRGFGLRSDSQSGRARVERRVKCLSKTFLS
jgi:hypothetical protein